LKEYFTDDNLLECHGGTSKYQLKYPDVWSPETETEK